MILSQQKKKQTRKKDKYKENKLSEMRE